MSAPAALPSQPLSPPPSPRCAAAIRSVCASCPSVEFILQCNTHTAPLWKRICGGKGGGDVVGKGESHGGDGGDGRARSSRVNGGGREAAQARHAGGAGVGAAGGLEAGMGEAGVGSAPAAPAPPSNLSLLYDESMGLGVTCSAWSAPHAGVPCGYAGGLSPENIKEQVSGGQRRALWEGGR